MYTAVTKESLFPEFIDRVQQGVYELYDMKTQGFCYVQDAVRAIINSKRGPGTRYNM